MEPSWCPLLGLLRHYPNRVGRLLLSLICLRVGPLTSCFVSSSFPFLVCVCVFCWGGAGDWGVSRPQAGKGRQHDSKGRQHDSSVSERWERHEQLTKMLAFAAFPTPLHILCYNMRPSLGFQAGSLDSRRRCAMDWPYTKTRTRLSSKGQ